MDQPQNPNHSDPVTPAGPADTAPPPPLTPTAWLMNNAIYLIILGAIVGVIWYKLGLDSVWYVAKVLLGLGFVIFIHELGHFLAAKWCDVHVQTFSIGFGPALPGCSFQRGETTYKIAVLPLGGYVNMIGEGPESDEDENYPRSFKNKTVGQRMLIISAGVIMNVLLGCALFIAVYYYHGVMENPAVVGRVDAAGPLWQKGIPSGALITDLGGIRDPMFKNLRHKVILSSAGEKLPFTFVTFNDAGERTAGRTVNLMPRLGENDSNPVVGVAPPEQLQIIPKQPANQPVTRGSAAAAARPIPLQADEVVIAATDPDNPDTLKEIEHDLKAGTFDFMDLSKRLRKLEGKKLVIRVKPKDASEDVQAVEREAPAEGFQFNDVIIGCTRIQDEAGEKYNPFLVEELPRDPRHADGDHRDPFVFHDRLRRLAGLPMIVQVRRGNPDSSDLRQETNNGPVVNLFVPPAFHRTLGMRMKMGKVAGVRDNSPAARAGVRKGDLLFKVVMKDEDDAELYSSAELDPERLPDELAKAAATKSGKKTVILTVQREPSESSSTAKDLTLEPVEWDANWDNDEEMPLTAASPLAVPQLGLAYWVLSQVVEVKADSPAARAGLQKEDTIKALRFQQDSPYKKEVDWSKWVELESNRDGDIRYDRWANTFLTLQMLDYPEIQVRFNRPGGETKDEVTLTAEEDTSWPLIGRGITLRMDFTLRKADNFGDALVMGGRDTREMIQIMFLQLKSLLTRRVSIKQMGGPLEMMRIGFLYAQTGNFELLLFLGMISINLAVVNFLPIPVLDGGHMVFLLYEKLRGRPPAENVKIVATYIGLAMILLLMVVVFFQDFRKLFGI